MPYKAHCKAKIKIVPCAKDVRAGEKLRFVRCRALGWVDGYCGVHHPKSVARRNARKEAIRAD